MTTQTFPMTLDKIHRWATCIVLGGVGVALTVGTVTSGGLPLPARLVAALTFLVLVTAFMLAPRALEIADGTLWIRRRLFAPFAVPLTDISGVQHGPVFERGAVRIFGVGYFFGSYGLFWMRGFGRFRFWATRRGPYVTVRRNQGLPMVLTPDDPERFKSALERCLSSRSR